MTTIAAITYAESSERIAAANLRATLSLLQNEIAAFLSNGTSDLQALDDVLFAAQDQLCNVERTRDEIADLHDEYAHNILMARRGA